MARSGRPMQALKRKGVDFIVAPYEADAQMAYLALNALVDVVITEDSDLLTYGCPRVGPGARAGGRGGAWGRGRGWASQWAAQGSGTAAVQQPVA